MNLSEGKVKIFITHLLTLAGITAWLLAIFGAPYFKNKGSILGAFLYSLFAPICHQIPQRSFYFLSHPLAVCGRCLGIYAGFFAGTTLYPLIRGFKRAKLPGQALLIAVSFPIVFDTAGNFFKIWSTSNPVRLLLGVSWGVILPYYFIPAVASISWMKKGR